MRSLLRPAQEHAVTRNTRRTWTLADMFWNTGVSTSSTSMTVKPVIMPARGVLALQQPDRQAEWIVSEGAQGRRGVHGGQGRGQTAVRPSQQQLGVWPAGSAP